MENTCNTAGEGGGLPRSKYHGTMLPALVEECLLAGFKNDLGLLLSMGVEVTLNPKP